MLDFIMDDFMGTDGILGMNEIFDAVTNETGSKYNTEQLMFPRYHMSNLEWHIF